MASGDEGPHLVLLREAVIGQVEARDEDHRCPDSQVAGAVRKKLGLAPADNLVERLMK
jgi:hypothetical protein